MPSGHLCRVVTEAICFLLTYFGELAFLEHLPVNIYIHTAKIRILKAKKLTVVSSCGAIFVWLDTLPQFHTQFLVLGDIGTFSLLANTNMIMDHSRMFLGIFKALLDMMWLEPSEINLEKKRLTDIYWELLALCCPLLSQPLLAPLLYPG